MTKAITIAFLFFSSLAYGQAPAGVDSAAYNITVPYRPVTLRILPDTGSRRPFTVNNVRSVHFTNVTPGNYTLQLSALGQDTITRDNIIVNNGRYLVLNFHINGPCLYDHPAGYIPVCPKGHKDSIIPIVYGLVPDNGNRFVKDKKDMQVKYAGCVVTDCDPQFYCKEHDLSF